MAQACPEYTYRQLAWIADWYVRDETCRRRLASIINTQRGGPSRRSGPPRVGDFHNFHAPRAHARGPDP